MDVQVGILAIGNEVVEGQITNRNAAWLSQELLKLGAKPLYHLSCRDLTEEIQSCLNYLKQHCHLIIISGGLGPTKDDRTRKVLSEWLGQPLTLHEQSWNNIQDKLKQRGLVIREGHKNQAYIPLGSWVLDNDKGVAPGFFARSNNCFLASLPGPPSELKPMFSNQLKPLIIDQIGPKSSETLHTWICLGAPESEIAHIAESILGEEFEIGYRLHRPYVELKVWTPTEFNILSSRIFQILEEKLSPWLVDRSIENIRTTFHQQLKKYKKVYVIDHLSSGLFLEKLKEDTRSPHIRYQSFEHEAFRFFKESEINNIISSMPQSEDDLLISLFPKSENSGFISLNQSILTVELPRKIPINSKLGQLYVIEQCFNQVNISE